MSSSKKTTKTKGSKGSKGSGKGKKAKTKAEQPEAVTAAAPEAPVAKDGKLSGLDAAAKVLAEAGEPLSAKAITDRMIANGLWKTEGKTPAATIYSAMFREIKVKGDASRFAKADKGKFTVAK